MNQEPNNQVVPNVQGNNDVPNNQVVPNIQVSNDVPNTPVVPNVQGNNDVPNTPVVPNVQVNNDVPNTQVAPSIQVSNDAPNTPVAPNIQVSNDVPYNQVNNPFNQGVNSNVNNQQMNNSLPPNPTEQVNSSSNNGEKNGKLTASLVLGIISVILSFILGIISLPISITGLIFSLTSKTKSNKKIAGIVLNTVSIIIAIVILFLSIGKLVNQLGSYFNGDSSDLKYNYNTPSPNDNETYEDDKISKITGGWLSLNDSETYWEFRDNQFWWYKSVYNLNDNYWYGSTEIVTGKEGLKLVGLSESKVDSIISQSSGNVTADDIFAIIMTPTKIISGGVDKSDTNIPYNAKWKYVWIIIDHGSDGMEGQVLNVSTYDTYHYVKYKD